MFSYRPHAFVAATLLFAAPLTAGAQDAERLKSMIDHAKERFAAADADHDGALTKAEAEKGMPFVAKHFDKIDTKQTGKVSLADVTKYMQERRDEQLKAKAEPQKDASPKAAEPNKDADAKKD